MERYAASGSIRGRQGSLSTANPRIVAADRPLEPYERVVCINIVRNQGPEPLLPAPRISSDCDPRSP